MNKDFITIIGAGPGISQAVARKFGKEGFRVALIARSEEKLKKMTAELAKDGIEAIYAAGDAAVEHSLQSALMNIRNSYGHAKMILYNAAAVDVKDILDQDWSTIKNLLDINAGGAFTLLKTVLPYCLKENTGKLFFTGGGLAMQGDPQWTSLSVGKAALRNVVQAFVKRAEQTNVHIAQLTVCGFVNPVDPKYSPQAIADQYWRLYNQKPGEFETEVMY